MAGGGLMERGVGRLTLEKTQEVAEEKHPADGRRGPGHPELRAAPDRLLAAAEQEPDTGAVDDPRGSHIDRDRVFKCIAGQNPARCDVLGNEFQDLLAARAGEP